LGTTLTWAPPKEATQYHLQVLPFANAGAGLNIIRNVEQQFRIPSPPEWFGLLPDMTYSWRIRVTDKPITAFETDTGWGNWSETWTFRTPRVSSEEIQEVFPASGSSGSPTEGLALQWRHPDPAVFYFEVQASSDSSFNMDPETATAPLWWNLVHGGVSVPRNSWAAPALRAGTTYHWRVRPRIQGDGAPVEWSRTFSFTTGGGPGTAGVAWRPLVSSSDAPSPRRDHSLVIDEAANALILFGDRSKGAALNDLWRYDLSRNTWERVAPVGEQPPARFGHGAVLDPDRRRMVVFGGQSARDFLSDLWEYDLPSGRWRLLTAMEPPEPRYGQGIALDPASGNVLISHGFTESGRFDDTWLFDVAGAVWRDRSPAGGPRPEKRCLLRTIWDPKEGRLLLFGGQSNTSPFLGDLWAYQPGKMWQQAGQGAPPSPRHFYSAASDTMRQRFLLFGGRTRDGDAGDLWEFDMAADKWRLLATGGPARNGHDAVYVPSRHALIVFGGAAGAELNDLWEASIPE